MPKLYTSPFWVPWGGCRSYMSSSGAVQSFSEKVRHNLNQSENVWNATVADVFVHKNTQHVDCINDLTYSHRVRASRRFRWTSGSWPSHNPWFSKQICCPRRNWMTSDFHGSQSSCCGDSSFPGGEKHQASQALWGVGSLNIFFFPLQQIIHEDTQIQTYGNNIFWQVDVCWRFWKEAVFLSRAAQSYWGMSVKLLLIPLVSGLLLLWMYLCPVTCGNIESTQTLKGSLATVFLCRTLLSVWGTSATALHHARSSILNPSDVPTPWQKPLC